MGVTSSKTCFSSPDQYDKANFASPDRYHEAKASFRDAERALSFDHERTQSAPEKERLANRIVQELRRHDKKNIYDTADSRLGFNGQKHTPFPGDQFLSSLDLIDQTNLYKVAQMMPKGAHLHIHFNSCLQPDVLLEVAKTQPRMFISSNRALSSGNGLEIWRFQQCKIQFSLLAEGEEKLGDIYSSKTYESGQHMLFAEFLKRFPEDQMGEPMRWLEEKLMFSAEETCGIPQTPESAWERFNGRTQMMKGLFNYEEAFRQYTRKLLESFADDNIQYAEIRPNFMSSNFLKKNDGSLHAGNIQTVEIIIQEYEAFQARKATGYFAGLKIIYCTPRSLENTKIADALKECLEFKKRWPTWIAGFDLVGEEGKGRPLGDFVPEFLQFQEDCKDAKVHIPYLFHCGETLDDPDGNLVDAVLLNSKRIGHGFALSRHPRVMQEVKEKDICIEACPISNEVLGLTPRINGHPMYHLLANNVHCTVSSDNGTIFRSTLSHDFYQVMVGKKDMTLHGWWQLIRWSFQHSCMEDKLRKEAILEWEGLWDVFLDAVNTKFAWVLSEGSDGHHCKA